MNHSNLSFIENIPIFQARYPGTFENQTDSNAFTASSHRVYQFIHKKLGLQILVAQKNPNRFTPAERDVGREKLKSIGGKPISFKTADHMVINGMHFIGKDCVENSPTLILFSGNGVRYEEYGSQTFSCVRLFTIKNWLKLGVNVLIFNYRGIEKNPGNATRNGLIFDGDAAVQYVRDGLKVPEEKIILHGHSLGGGIASEVAVLHPTINYCNDRSFSSLSQQVKMMLGGGILGALVSKLLNRFGWEFNTVDNWKKIKGHKWIVYHPNDPAIRMGARLIDAISTVDSQASILQMQSQRIQTKKGSRPEDANLLQNPTKGDISFAGSSSHMRKLRGNDEKGLYEKQIKISLANRVLNHNRWQQWQTIFNLKMESDFRFLCSFNKPLTQVNKHFLSDKAVFISPNHINVDKGLMRTNFMHITRR